MAEKTISTEIGAMDDSKHTMQLAMTPTQISTVLHLLSFEIYPDNVRGKMWNSSPGQQDPHKFVCHIC